MDDERTVIQLRKEVVTSIIKGGPLQQMPLPEVFGSARLALVTGLVGFDAPTGLSREFSLIVGARGEDSANDLVQRFGEDLWVVALDEGVLEVRGRIYRLKKGEPRRYEREVRGTMDALAPALEADLLTVAGIPSFERWLKRGIEKPILLRVSNTSPTQVMWTSGGDLPWVVQQRFRYQLLDQHHREEHLRLLFLEARREREGQELGARSRLFEIIGRDAAPLLRPTSGGSDSSALKADPVLALVGSAMRQKLLEVLPARAAEVWLTSPNSMLDGAAPIDVLLDEPSRSDEVQAALDAFAAGVF